MKKNSDFMNRLITASTGAAKSSAASKNIAATFSALDYHSVFDIIRGPKNRFVSQARAHAKTDGVAWDVVYDNAVCYALQLHREFLEKELRSPTPVRARPRSGLRGLVDNAPDYPSLFNENWDRFCKAGAFESRSGPAAYLADLYREATEVFEKLESQGASERPRILLEKRRADLAKLIVDEASMNQRLSMLTLVNEILINAIQDYRERTEQGTSKSLYQVFAEKAYPLNFPYNFYHHQVVLGLGRKQVLLGSLMLNTLPAIDLLPKPQRPSTEVFNLMLMMTALSAEQQASLTQPHAFAMFNVTLGEINDTGGWYAPVTSKQTLFIPHHSAANIGFTVLAEQAEGPTQPHYSDTAHGPTLFKLRSNELTLRGQSVLTGGLKRVMRRSQGGQQFFLTCKADEDIPAEPCSARFTILPWRWPVQAEPAIPMPAWALDVTVHIDENNRDNFALTEEQSEFMRQHYGVALQSGRDAALAPIPELLKRTGLNSEQLDQLLARGKFAPVISPNFLPGDALLTDFPDALSAPYQYGAVYLNGGFPEAMDIENVSFDSDRPAWQLVHHSPDRFDCLQRMVRLQRWLDLPFSDIDSLIAASFHAEEIPQGAYKITRNTLRSFGVFREFQQKYGIEIGDFCALLNHIAIHGVGNKTPLFDRIFNTPQLFDQPLILDNSPFSGSVEPPAVLVDMQTWAASEAGTAKKSKSKADGIGKSPEQRAAAAQRIVKQLCHGLGLQATAESYGRVAAETQRLYKKLELNLDVVSSLYRQARLAKLFGLKVGELLDLLNLLGGPDYVDGIVKPRLVASEDVQDTLYILLEIDTAVRWLKESKLSVAALREVLGLDGGGLIDPAGTAQFIQTLAQNIKPTLVTKQTFQHSGLPTDIDWMELLSTGGEPILDHYGLVISLPLSSEETITEQLKEKVEELSLPEQDRERAVSILVSLLHTALLAQENQFAASLNQAFRLPLDLARLVVPWAGRPISEWLHQTLNIADATPDDIPDEYNAGLYSVARHTSLAITYKFSAPMLRLFLSRSGCFGLESPRLNMHSLYLLTRYVAWRDAANVPEEELLSYLETFNPTKNEDAESAWKTLARLLGWTTEAVKAAGAALDIEDSVPRTMAQIDRVMRMQALSIQTGLPAGDLNLLMHLSPESDFADWQRAGESVMASLAH
ncbi:Tc toxin subunit A [Bradyrhizobium prioriisuperbiae]|uniref:Tc toxin subunit A n=1 Tax=Bradyrhizobium prioriisuperbiae TaxID=2854389 RepID=UPI0028E6462A|nr:Tc toxin subunit A [Bradyrhizobium prioritasuperba]